MPNTRVALITGGIRGIGLAISCELARHGITPILNYRQDSAQAQKALREVRTLDPKAQVFQADVTAAAEVAKLVDACEALGPLEVLVNNVGAFLWKPWLVITPEEWDRVLSSNLRSMFLCCRTVLPHMRVRGTGNVVNVLAMHTERIRAVPNSLPYAIAKTGGALLTKTLAKTEAPFGIRINAIGPGFVESGEHTPQDAVRRIPMGRLTKAHEIAEAVCFLVSAHAAHITGQILDVHGGALL